MRHIRFLFFLCLLSGVGACLMAKRELFPPPPDGPLPKIVYVMSNGWHAGLVLPRADIPQDVVPACQDFACHRFVEVGWGAKGFYMSRNITPTLVMRTLCWPSPSVMHVVGFDEPPELVFQNVDLVEIQLSEAGYHALCQFVGDAMARDDQSQPVRLGPGLYGVSQFYDANGLYYYPNTCNQWTARALREAGCPITPLYASTAQNVMFQVRCFGRVVRER